MGWHLPTGAPTRDWLDHDAASDLAAKISSYWAKRGKLVRTWVIAETSANFPNNQKQIWSVRSDLKVASGVWRKS